MGKYNGNIVLKARDTIFKYGTYGVSLVLALVCIYLFFQMAFQFFCIIVPGSYEFMEKYSILTKIFGSKNLEKALEQDECSLFVLLFKYVVLKMIFLFLIIMIGKSFIWGKIG